MGKTLAFTRRAANVLAERGIEKDWVETVLANPDRSEIDARDMSRSSKLGKVPEFGDRWLRVVYVETNDEIRVITAFFDRRMETAMKATYDQPANALYLRFTDAAIDASEEVRPGLIIDFDANGRMVAFEMLDADAQLTPGALADIAMR